LLAKNTELVAVLGAKLREKCGHAVVIVLAPFLERMVVTLGALHAHAQENLGGRLRPFGSGIARAIKVGGSVREGTPFRGDDVAHHGIDWPAITQAVVQPVTEAPHALLVQ